MKRHSPPLRRRKAQLSPKSRILIVCEGEVTEPSYFDGLKRLDNIRLVDIIIDRSSGQPKSLVERAVAEKKAALKKAKRAGDENLKYDELWCVFDIDDHPKVPDAKQQAQAHGISLAISNPCFELWLLLHFTDQKAHLHRHDAQTECCKYLKDYKKNVAFEKVQPYIDDAIRRATDLEQWQSSRRCAEDNPSTSVHRLVLRIKELGKAASLKRIRDLQIRSGYHEAVK